MVGMSIARSTRSGTFVGPGICKKCLPVWTIGLFPSIFCIHIVYLDVGIQKLLHTILVTLQSKKRLASLLQNYRRNMARETCSPVTGWFWDRCGGFRYQFGRFSLAPRASILPLWRPPCDFKSCGA